MPWNPEQYEKFKAQRKEPFYDLLKLIEVKPNLSVVDLGCGTGELTRDLADYLPNSTVLGVDNSPEMLTKADQYANDRVRFELGQLETVTGEWDIVFSNAAIQWVADHEHLIPRLLGLVKQGGQLVIQQPANYDNPAHVSIRTTAEEDPFRTALGDWNRETYVKKAELYGEWLYAAGGRDLTLIEKVYPHVLPDVDAVIEWISGTALVPYIEALPAELHQPFRAAIRAKLLDYYGTGEVFFGFRRMILVATRV